jgi:phage terminase small subunit
MILREKQKRFADYYLETGIEYEAYIKAGYKVKSEAVARANASRLLTNANVKIYIAERLKEIEDARIAKPEEVMKFLSASMRGEITEEVVVVEGCGEGCSDAKTVEKQISAKERIKAAELIGKRYALFTEKVNLSGNLGVQIVDDIHEPDD